MLVPIQYSFNIRWNPAKELGSHFNIYKGRISRTRLHEIGCVQQLQLIKHTSNWYLVSIKRTRDSGLYNQACTHGINKLEDKRIHIFYIKKITDLTNVFEDTENSKFFEGYERRNLKCNSECIKFYFTRPIFLASVSYINNLHILTIKTSASSSSTYRPKDAKIISGMSSQQ